jgi:hypothetical protein
MWLLVARMAGWRLALPLLKRAVSLERLVRLTASPRNHARDPHREELVVQIGGRLWRRSYGPCLERSLAIHRQLGLAGAAPLLALGVGTDAGAVIAHAWVLLDRAALLEQSNPAAKYGIVVVFDERGFRTS